MVGDGMIGPSPFCMWCKKYHRFDPVRMMTDKSYTYDADKMACDQFPEGIPEDYIEGGQDCPYGEKE